MPTPRRVTRFVSEMAPTRLQMMPTVASVLRSYFPARLLAGRVPLVRRVPNHVARIPTLQPVGLLDFLALEIPPRTMLLDPILPERSLAMLYAPRGIGKSWLGLSVGLAVASGSPLLRWTVPRPRHVLCIDGEMPLAELQLRLASIKAGMDVAIPNDRFRILAADNTETGINLSSNEGQQGTLCTKLSASVPWLPAVNRKVGALMHWGHLISENGLRPS